MKTLLYILLFFLPFAGTAQPVTIYGNSVVSPGSWEYYSVSWPQWHGYSQAYWNVSGGTIMYSDNWSCTVQWDNINGYGSISVSEDIYGQWGDLGVQIGDAEPYIYPTIQYPGYGTTPSDLYISWTFTPDGSESYQWQEQSGVMYFDIPGAIYNGYTPPVITTSPKYYRCIVTYHGTPYYLDAELRIPDLNPGSISASSAVQYNQALPTVYTNNASGGYCLSSNYAYQWEVSVYDGPWTAIGATAAFPGGVNAVEKTRIRRKVTCGGVSVYTNVLEWNPVPVATDWENYNYVREHIVKRSNVNYWGQADLLPIGEKTQVTTYYDGLGRPVQKVNKSASGTLDLVDHFNYSVVTESKEFVPYATSDAPGKFKTNAATSQPTYVQAFFNEPSSAPTYKVTVTDASPLARPAKHLHAGQSWGGSQRGSSTQYWFNISTDDVKIWTVSNAGTQGDFGSYSISGVYPDGALSKVVTEDEKGAQVIEFRDKEDLLILKKTQLTASKDQGGGSSYPGWLCTYFIYDNLNQLRATIQPKGVELLYGNGWNFTTDILEELCFRYEYDGKKRQIVKKTPGAAPIQMIFDARNRLVLSQDGKMRDDQQWLYATYDAFNRQVSTGLINDPSNYNNPGWHRQQAYNSAVYPNVNAYASELLTESHYDNYQGLPSGLSSSLVASDVNGTNFITTYNSSPLWAQEVQQSSNVQGVVTWSRAKILGTGNFTSVVNIYDDKGRVIQTQSRNHTNGTDVQSFQYDFSGRLLRTHIRYSHGSAASVGVAAALSYDNQGRILKVEKNLNGTGWKKISEISYDALGRMKQKKLSPDFNNAAGIETLTDDYNIRGWLLGSNRDYAKSSSDLSHYFGFELAYDQQDIKTTGGSAIGTYTTPLYNGNITGTVWKSKGDNEIRKFDYSYDASNRILGANFTQYTSGSFNTSAQVDFSVLLGDGSGPQSAYDANGNIKKMSQKALKVGSSSYMDQLTYSYHNTEVSNRLKVVTDDSNDPQAKLGDFSYEAATKTATDFDYDAAGNMITDRNKKISSIQYNHLHLPSLITIAGKGTIAYTYDAQGSKLKKVVTDNTGPSQKITTTDYISGAVYSDNVLQYIPHEEGRIRYIPAANGDPEAWVYDYFLKDHLANTRMVLSEEVRSKAYQAGMEPGIRSFEVDLFGNKVNSTAINKPSGFDNDGGNATVSRVNGSSADDRVGPGLILKVMAGDKFKTRAFAWYLPSGTDQSIDPGLPAILSTVIAQLVPGISEIAKGSAAAQLTNPVVEPGVTNFLNSQSPAPGAPKAFLNWILLDEEMFKKVDGSSGNLQVPTITGTQEKQLMQGNNGSFIDVKKNGYLYVYVSNESRGNVYFDDIRVEHVSGALLEETHYYPFGLPMAGISSKAALVQDNKLRFNGKETQTREFTDDSGLEMYDFKYRFFDMQLGRFFNQDRLADKYAFLTPYQFSSNNPIWMREIDGLEGAKYTETDAAGNVTRTVIEKNIVVMLESKKEIPKDATEKQIKKINRENARIDQRNEQRMTEAREELNTYFNGSEGKGAKGKKDQLVYFSFNLIGMPDINTGNLTKEEKKNIDSKYREIARGAGIDATYCVDNKDQNFCVPAGVFTSESTGAALGITHGAIIIRLGYVKPAGTFAHEVAHTLGLDDNNYTSGGIRNSPPESINAEEVELILKQAFDKKK